MDRKTPEEKQVEDNKKIIDKIVGDDQVKYSIKNLSIHEEDEEMTRASFILSKSVNHQEITSSEIVAFGDGFFDAIFNGCIDYISDDYHSLKNFRIESYRAEADISCKNDASPSLARQTDSLVKVRVRVYNLISGAGGFTASDRSLLRASVRILEGIVTHLVNAEIAALKLRDFISNKKTREPAILTSDLSDLIKVSSFREVFRNQDKSDN